MRSFPTAALILLSAAAGLAEAGQSVKAPAPVAKSAKPVSQATAVAPTKRSVISGRVVDVNSNPVPNAAVRLRNLQANKIEQSLTANRTGEFTFVAQADIPYVVEVIDRGGRVISVGEVIIPQAGEVVGAIVRIPVRIPTIAGIFGETTGSIIAATAGMGITAVQSSVPDPPLSPEE